ncbi:hybrid-cluster NAD(P)-dependent oxidoreductase [Notoacmeibacter sp. MSK16QG-6]|uniref:hybrid-cluster NAD(P)-dependent oxidoreductase n=1 Tax=Notoacmeibacter sp. MSK16QG-6 TaxID=2957982 RepID=UPI00209CDE98|nr:hybrid-cluster NAD(P)-dependent oxidoreductase [Notoacmeibacter sp. MSK16QG-6]MCP1200786.1 hybrid-cluster NAD(P)-dependent oxidoreductase [Notoacmeibacter sp. MSK16QG-6]
MDISSELPPPNPVPTGYYRWEPDEDDVLICRAVREETHDVKTFVFAPRFQRQFEFVSGQFLTFDFDIDGETFHRCYTISSPPSRPDTVSITVKRVPGGPVSNWLHDYFRPGMMLKATVPMGEFSWAGMQCQKFLFLSGGSGITPLMSMTRSSYDLALVSDIAFVHAARTPADIIFRDELEFMSRRNRSIRPFFTVEDNAPGQSWAGYRGRLSRSMLNVICPDFLEREVFVCGPRPFMAAAKALLEEAGLDMDRYHQESFDFDDFTDEAQETIAEAAGELDSDVKRYRVEFTKTDRVVYCPADITVLEAARRAGMRLPFSCAKGLCGTCKSKIASGTVEMTHSGGIRQREIDKGMALLCCSKPTSDLVVER